MICKVQQSVLAECTKVDWTAEHTTMDIFSMFAIHFLEITGNVCCEDGKVLFLSSFGSSDVQMVIASNLNTDGKHCYELSFMFS